MAHESVPIVLKIQNKTLDNEMRATSHNVDGSERKLRVLMSAYACEPGKGSEPEVGWRAAMSMSDHCDLKVITRANNRPLIERELEGRGENGPEFLYYDLPAPFLFMKRKFSAVGLYYFLWQLAVRFVFRRALKDADVVHHVTFNGAQIPGFWVATDTPVVLGPLGGGMTCPEMLLSVFGKEMRREKFRSMIVNHLSWIPWWPLVIRNARVVLAANRETAETLRKNASVDAPVMLETAIDSRDLVRREEPGADKVGFTFLWLGGIIPRKAGNLAILALNQALGESDQINLWFAGGGSEEANLRSLVSDLGLGERVSFLGRVRKSEVNSLMDAVDALVFTSVRDTSGNVVLEAMSRSLPILAIRHQGVREMCDDSCAVLVEPGDVDETVAGFASGMVFLANNPSLAGQMGLNGQRRISSHLTWRNYSLEMMKHYRNAVLDS